LKKFGMFLICAYVLLLTGCDHIGEIENNRVITACFVNKTDSATVYSFYVSVPSGGEGGEDTGSKSSAKVYDFKASDLTEAIQLFEKSGVEKTDVKHISLFVGNEKYFHEEFSNDEKHIRKNITATPLVYCCIYEGKQDDLVECINKEYNSKAEDFAENIFSDKTSELNCMLSELVLSVNNNEYTSAVPIIEINKKGKNKLPEIKNTAIYSKEKGINILDEKNHDIYVKWQKKYTPLVRGYTVDVDDDKFNVKLKDGSILTLAKKLAEKDIDILNVKYHGKKCFFTFNKYLAFINNSDFKKTVFKSE